MIKFFQTIAKNNTLTLLVLGAFIAIGSLSLDKFRFDASSDTLILDSDPSYELYEEINDRFSSSEFLVIALEDDNIFSEESLKQLLLLENQLENIDGVSNVISQYWMLHFLNNQNYLWLNLQLMINIFFKTN